ncbi:MAG: co-chaperone GroES [Armatimonadota bacterium]
MLKPLGNRVLVKQLEEDDTTAGGIVLPDSARKKPQEAEVVAVGEGERLESGKVLPISLKVGDVIVYPEYSGTEVRINEEDYMIIDVDSVLALKQPAKKKRKKSAKRKS